MHDPLPVRLVQPLRYLASDLQHLIDRQRPFLQALCHGLALQVLHEQEINPVLRAYVV